MTAKHPSAGQSAQRIDQCFTLTSSVLEWPDRETVGQAAPAWAAEEARRHPELVRLGIFGSWASGDWGVGSDLDLVAVVRGSDRPFHERARDWAYEKLPVPADLLVYTEAEWGRLMAEGSRFARMLRERTRWIWPERPDGDAA